MRKTKNKTKNKQQLNDFRQNKLIGSNQSISERYFICLFIIKVSFRHIYRKQKFHSVLNNAKLIKMYQKVQYLTSFDLFENQYWTRLIWKKRFIFYSMLVKNQIRSRIINLSAYQSNNIVKLRFKQKYNWIYILYSWQQWLQKTNSICNK